MSPVMEIELWPTRSEMALMWIPDSNQPVAAEWRIVWTPMWSTPAFSARPR